MRFSEYYWYKNEVVIYAGIMRIKSLAFYLSNQESFYREVVEGIGAYLQHHPEWEMLWQDQHLFWKNASVWASRADAVICGRLRGEDRLAMKGYKGRVISISNFTRQDFVDSVLNDDREVGRAAGRHLTGLGFRQLAFVNFANAVFSAERFAGVREIFAGVEASRVAEFRLKLPEDMPRLLEEIRGQFPVPFALYCDTDLAAVILANAAVRAGLRIPEDAVLLGTNNAPLLTDFCRPRLSSVALDTQTIARKICEQLETPRKPGRSALRIEVPPLGVVARRSTDHIALEDSRVAKALALMRAERGKAVTVDEAAKAAGMSRRLLEIKFKESLKRSPYQEILRLRVDHARELLKRSDWSIGRIAEEAGFEDHRAFNKAFLKEVRQSPRDYRKGGVPETMVGTK